VVANAGNQSQIRFARDPQEQAKTVAVGCARLPIGAHGKEGVDGSSPSEGSFSKNYLQIGQSGCRSKHRRAPPCSVGTRVEFAVWPAKCLQMGCCLGTTEHLRETEGLCSRGRQSATQNRWSWRFPADNVVTSPRWGQVSATRRMPESQTGRSGGAGTDRAEHVSSGLGSEAEATLATQVLPESLPRARTAPVGRIARGSSSRERPAQPCEAVGAAMSAVISAFPPQRERRTRAALQRIGHVCRARHRVDEPAGRPRRPRLGGRDVWSACPGAAGLRYRWPGTKRRQDETVSIDFPDPDKTETSATGGGSDDTDQQPSA
jgi:hypothetical protein